MSFRAFIKVHYGYLHPSHYIISNFYHPSLEAKTKNEIYVYSISQGFVGINLLGLSPDIFFRVFCSHLLIWLLQLRQLNLFWDENNLQAAASSPNYPLQNIESYFAAPTTAATAHAENKLIRTLQFAAKSRDCANSYVQE